MNDLESRLRSLRFREPPPGLRGVVLAAVRAPGWRNWLAPHPGAWIGLAAAWLVLTVLDNALNAPDANSRREVAVTAAPPPPAAILLAFYQQPGAFDPTR